MLIPTLKPGEVILPWPPKDLNPNARVHWSKRAKAAKAYRKLCWGLCKEAKLSAPPTPGKLHLWLSFYPPDKRNRDDDNIIASFKSGRDGIADALGMDDSRFVCHPMVMLGVRGHVLVRLTEGPR